jgi:hypothetical protein
MPISLNPVVFALVVARWVNTILSRLLNTSKPDSFDELSNHVRIEIGLFDRAVAVIAAGAAGVVE